MKAETFEGQTNLKESSSLNEVFKAIYSRRAVRIYKDQPVSQTIIDQVIDAGRMAPSAMNRQPWNFYVLTDKELIKSFSKQIAKQSIIGIAKMGLKNIAKSVITLLHAPHDTSFFKGDDHIFHGAPVVIFLSAPKDNEWAAIDIGACAQNMMLAAKSLGIDSCPVGLAKFVEGTKLYSKLNIIDTDHVLLAIIMGYGDESPVVHERNRKNIQHVD